MYDIDIQFIYYTFNELMETKNIYCIILESFCNIFCKRFNKFRKQYYE